MIQSLKKPDSFQKCLKVESSHHPAIPLLRTYLREMKTYLHIKLVHEFQNNKRRNNSFGSQLIIG